MSEEPKAKDILEELTKRRTLLERMTERMLPRAFRRISVASSARLFDYFDVPDPYSPILQKRKKWKSEIGTSALILGENRREVAPHSKVPDLKPKKSEVQNAPQQFRPQGIPSAPRREESRPPPPPPKPSHNEFGSGQKHGLVGKLPMRPDMQKPDTTNPNATPVAKPPPRSSSTTASRPSERPMPAPTRQFASPKGRGKVNRGLPPSGGSGGQRPSPEELASRRPPVTSGQQKQAKTDGLRMKRTKITKRSPVIREVVKPVEVRAEVPESPQIDHSPKQHRPASSMDLDDLFGFGGQDEGRINMPKRTKKKN